MFATVRFYGFKEFVASLSKEFGGEEKKVAKEIKEMIQNGKKFGDILNKFPQIGYSYEYILFTKGDRYRRLGYINVGETYTPTLVRDFKGNVRFISIGDFIESAERLGWKAE